MAAVTRKVAGMVVGLWGARVWVHLWSWTATTELRATEARSFVWCSTTECMTYQRRGFHCNSEETATAKSSVLTDALSMIDVID